MASTLNIMLIRDGSKLGRKAKTMVESAGFGVAVSIDAQNVSAVLEWLNAQKPDVVILVRSEDRSKYIAPSIMAKIREMGHFIQMIVMAESDDKEASKIALDWDAAWVIDFDDSTELVEMVLKRVERKHTAFMREYANQEQRLFSEFLKDGKNRMPGAKARLFEGRINKEFLFQIVKVRVLPPYQVRKTPKENSPEATKGYLLLLSRLEKLSKYFIARDGPDLIICIMGDSGELCLAKQQLRKYIMDMAEMALSTEPFFTWICMGNIVQSEEEIQKSLRSASELVNERFFKAGSDMLEQRQFPEIADGGDRERIRFFDVKKSLLNSMESFDEQGIHKILMQLKSNILSFSNFSGNNLYTTYKTLVSGFFQTVESREIDLTDTGLSYNSMLMEYDYFRTIDDIFDCVEQMFVDGVNLLKAEEEDKLPVAIVLAKRYIRAYFNMPLTLSEISDYVGMDESYFSNYFGKHVKMTFKQYQTNLRIHYAKRLLLDKNYSLEDISDAVGYSSFKYFSRVFKRETSIAPGEYRNKHHAIGDIQSVLVESERGKKDSRHEEKEKAEVSEGECAYSLGDDTIKKTIKTEQEDGLYEEHEL